MGRLLVSYAHCIRIARLINDTHRDLLELKEIQRSLPRANQLDDPVSGKRASHFLSSVPIGLLPLLPESPTSSQTSSRDTSPVTSPPLTPALFPNLHWLAPPPQQPRPAPSIPRPWHPPYLAHLPNKPHVQREKPKFAFLPLLDTPPSSESSSPYTSSPSSPGSSPERPIDTDVDTDSFLDPPTPPLTNASLDSSPRSQPSSVEPSPETNFLHLTPLGIDKHGICVVSLGPSDDPDPDFDPHHPNTDPHIPDALPDDVLPSIRSLRGANNHIAPIRPSSLFFPPPRSGTTAWNAFPLSRSRDASSSPSRSTPKPPPTRRRNIMVLNGVEIDIGDDDDDDTDNNHNTGSADMALETPRSSVSTPLASPHTIRDESTPPVRGRALPVLLPPPLSFPLSALPSPSSPVYSPSCPATARCASETRSPLRFQRDRPVTPAAI